jgi:hypothetical protein
VQEISAARRGDEARDTLRQVLIAALVAVYPDDGFENPASSPYCLMIGATLRGRATL